MLCAARVSCGSASVPCVIAAVQEGNVNDSTSFLEHSVESSLGNLVSRANNGFREDYSECAITGHHAPGPVYAEGSTQAPSPPPSYSPSLIRIHLLAVTETSFLPPTPLLPVILPL